MAIKAKELELETIGMELRTPVVFRDEDGVVRTLVSYLGESDDAVMVFGDDDLVMVLLDPEEKIELV